MENLFFFDNFLFIFRDFIRKSETPFRRLLSKSIDLRLKNMEVLMYKLKFLNFVSFVGRFTSSSNVGYEVLKKV